MKYRIVINVFRNFELSEFMAGGRSPRGSRWRNKPGVCRRQKIYEESHSLLGNDQVWG